MEELNTVSQTRDAALSSRGSAHVQTCALSSRPLALHAACKVVQHIRAHPRFFKEQFEQALSCCVAKRSTLALPPCFCELQGMLRSTALFLKIPYYKGLEVITWS